MPKLSAFRKALRSQIKADKFYNMAFKPTSNPVFASVSGYFYEGKFLAIIKKMSKKGTHSGVQPL